MISLLRWLDRNIEAAAIAILLSLIVGSILLQVFMRYVLQNSFSWTEELTLWFFAWFIWIGISYGFKNQQHINISFFQNLFNENIGRIIQLAINILILAFFVILIYQCVDMITMPYVLKQKSVVLQLPIPYLYSSAPVGATLCCIRILQNSKVLLCDIRRLGLAEEAR
jgi:TRAP-type transport system small permease protein